MKKYRSAVAEKMNDKDGLDSCPISEADEDAEVRYYANIDLLHDDCKVIDSAGIKSKSQL